MADNIKNLGKVCITPEGVWDVNKEYDRLSLVVTTDVNTQKALSYVSRKHVPKGNINIKDTEYWQLFTTELKLEDITIDENGNVKIGDVVIYQISLGDALGEIVVNKIKHDLTDYIMAEIRSYMTSMVQELINSFSNQIGRLINTGIEIRNKVSGGMTNHNVDEITHYGNININHNGRVEEILSGNVGVNAKVSGSIYVDGDEPSPTPKYLVTINTNPSDAIVTLNGVHGNSGEFEEGSTVSVVVSKSGYVTKTESITNLQQDTTLDITLVAETVQYFFRINPTEKSVGAISSEFTVNVESVKNNQRYEYEYTIEDSDNIIQSITKVTGGVKIVTNGNALDRTKTATIYFKQHRPEEEVMNVTIPFVITQESDTPSSYVFISDQIRQWDAVSADNGLDGIPVGTGEYGQNVTTPPSIDLVSTKNGESFDYEIVQKPDWINLTKDLENNKLNYTLNAVNLPYLYSQEKGTIILRQFDSGKTLQFTLIRVDNLLYVIDNPFTYNKNAHYTEKLKVISCHCTHSYGFGYRNDSLSLANSDHPNWISITNDDLQNARTVAYANYPTGTYFEVPISIQQNTGNQRTGTVTIINGVSTVTIDITQEGEDTPPLATKYRVTVNPIPADATVTINDVATTSAEFDEGSNISIVVSKTGYITETRTITNIQEDTILNITLEQEPVPTTKYTVTVNPTPSDALVTLNDGLNPGEFDAGTDVRVFVSKYGYIAHEETITNLQENKILNITLEQETDEFYAAQTDMQFTLDGGQLPNTIVSLKNGSFIGYVLTSKPEWATVTLDYEGDQNRINVVVGNTSSARSGNIVLTQNETGNTLTIGVSQNNTYELNVATKSFNIVSGGEQKSTLYTSTLNGNYVDPIVTPSDSWITYQLLSNGNNHYIQITVAENTATSQRIGTISVVNGDKSETITIIQDAAPAQDTYEFSSDKQSLSFAAADGSKQTAKVTSTKNGSRIDTSIDSKPGWITVNQVIDGTGTNYLFTAAANSNTESRSGNIVVKQQRGSSFETITIAVTQEGSSAPPTPTYEFVGILGGAGGDFEQSLDTAIRLTTADNSVTLTPRVKIDGQLRTDVDVNITSDGFSQGAQNVDKFKVESDGMILTIGTSGEEPSEPISTSYDITVRYDNHTENFTFAIDWDV